ncbi:Protein required for attachment to host cells [Ensifer adhaerens]|nr:Protein required for attachment to host cells [Ensifer adhaerens]
MRLNVTIPAGALVIVADHNKSLFLKNDGKALTPHLDFIEELQADANPLTWQQGVDRPGRTAMGDRRSAYAETDWHELAASQFMENTAQRITELGEIHSCEAFVIVAPPKALGQLRQALPEVTRDKIYLEISKDLTHLPVEEITDYLTP